MTVHIDLAKAQSLIAECIKERGKEYVYEKEGVSCKYVHNIGNAWDSECEEYEYLFENATPGCMVGLALHKAGVPLEFMGKRFNMEGSSDLMEGAEDAGYITFTSAAAAYFANCQSSQDSGAEWGKAADAALRGQQFYKDRDPLGDGASFIEVDGQPIE